MNLNEKEEKVQEWFESNDPEIDFNELNKANIISRYTKTPTTNIDTTEVNLTTVFTNLQKVYENNDNPTVFVPKSYKRVSQVVKEESDEEDVSKVNDTLNPIEKSNKILNELKLIEKDLRYYKENNNQFKGKYTLTEATEELEICKKSLDFVQKSKNYKIINDLISKGIPLDNNGTNSVLNKSLHEKLNSHLINKVSIINKLKDHKLFNITDAEFQLFLTPDKLKIKMFSKMSEIKKSLEDIVNKIGSWDMRTKKQSISEIVNHVKNNLRLLDKEYQKELSSKLENLSFKLKDIVNDDNLEFYKSSLDKKKIGELHSHFQSVKEVEELIYKSISKLESYKTAHEESAYIFVKLQEIIENQEKIKQDIFENARIISNLDLNMKENISMINTNLQILKKRLKSMKK